MIDGYKEILSEYERKRILHQNEKFARDGLRVIGIAYKEFYRNVVSKHLIYKNTLEYSHGISLIMLILLDHQPDDLHLLLHYYTG